MIVRSLRKRLSKAEVYIEFNDPNKVIIRDIIDYYKYLDDLDTDPELDKKELIYKPRPRKSPKETFCDLMIKYDPHYAGYVGDEIANSLCSGSAGENEDETTDEPCEITPEKPGENEELNTESGSNENSAEKQLKKDAGKLINIQPVKENEQPPEKIKRRKALECCGSFG